MEMTVAQNLINQYGTENIFMTMCAYHGRYEDDDCTFEYYNNVTGEFHKDEWTTRFACPAYSKFEAMPLRKGIKEGLVDTEKLLKILKEKQTRKGYFGDGLKESPYATGLRVEVAGGRKWKGQGIFAGVYRTSSGFGESTSFKVYDPMTGRIEYVTPKFVKFIDEERIKEDYVKEYNRRLQECTVDDIKYDDYRGISLDVTVETFFEFAKQYTRPVDLANAYDEVEIENRRKAMEFRTKKMAELLKWAKEKAGKTDEREALELAIRVFNKNY